MNHPPAAPAASQRAYWLKTLHQWHWISSALCLIGMLLFAFTGITLNHAADIPATPVVQNKTLELPAELKAALAVKDDEPDNAALPPELRGELLPRSNLAVYNRQRFPDPVLGERAAPGTTVFETDSVRMWHDGDGIAVLSFKTKMNTVGDGVLAGIGEAIDRAREAALAALDD